MNAQIVELPFSADLDQAVEAAVQSCGNDPRAAVRALILAQRQIVEQMGAAVSTGYVRGTIR